MKAMKLDNLACADLFQKLSLLLHSGVTVSSGLLILSEDEPDAAQRELLLQMAQQTEDGCAFYEALSRSECFPGYAVGLMEVAERVGRMEETLLSLSRYYEDRARISRSIRNALAFPSLLVVMMLAVLVIILSRVFPVFDEVYSALGGSMTGIASGLLAFGQMLSNALPVLGVLAGAIIVAVAIACLIPSVSDFFKKLFLRLTGDRGIWRKVNSSHFAQAMALALSCGLPMEEGLELATKLLADNPAALRRCQDCQKHFQDTADLVSALRNTDILSPASCQMLSISLQVGKADATMQQIADRMSNEADEAIEKKQWLVFYFHSYSEITYKKDCTGTNGLCSLYIIK